MHRSAHVFLFDGQGRLFLQQRGKEKDRFPLRYDSSAAGHVAIGESYDRCAERELAEELGVSARVSRLQSFSACADLGWEHVMLYKAVSDGPITVNVNEVENGRFLPLLEIELMIQREPHLFTPDFIYLFSWYMRHARPPRRRAGGKIGSPG